MPRGAPSAAENPRHGRAHHVRHTQPASTMKLYAVIMRLSSAARNRVMHAMSSPLGRPGSN